MPNPDTFRSRFLFAGLPFGIIMGLLLWWTTGNRVGFGIGAICGLFFGVIVAFFVKVQEKKMSSTDGLFEEETIHFEGMANHFLKMESRGGKLVLTSTRLAFRSHGKNIQNSPLDIPLQEIRNVLPVMVLWLIPKGLRVSTKDGNSELFVVSNHKVWAGKIMKQHNSSS